MHSEITVMHRPQLPKLFACTIRWIARLTSHPAAVAVDSYAMAIACVFHGSPVRRSSSPLLVLVLRSIHAGFFSRGVCPHFNARRCAHGLCVNRAQADPSLMRRERLNRHLICSSPVRLQRVRVCARDTRLNGESRGESDLYSNTSPPLSCSGFR